MIEHLVKSKNQLHPPGSSFLVTSEKHFQRDRSGSLSMESLKHSPAGPGACRAGRSSRRRFRIPLGSFG